MEGLKKNLHFIIFGSGIVLGLVLLGIGYSIKSGKLDKVATATSGLPKAAALPSRGDAEALKAARESFNASYERALNGLNKEKGVVLRQGADQFSPSDFWTRRANSATTGLKARFEALRAPIAMPEEVKPRVLPDRSAQLDFWTGFATSLSSIQSDVAKVVEFEIQLRIIEEVCVICERLKARDDFRDASVTLWEFKFNFTSSEAADSPWREYPFTVSLECPASFASALADELANPTVATLGDQDSGRVALGFGRRLFPVELVEVQLATRERPGIIVADIKLEDRAARNIPADADPSDPAVREKAAEYARELTSRVRLNLPVDAAVSAKALSFNPAWRALADEAQTP